jgi:dipeptidyl-peptidase-4
MDTRFLRDLAETRNFNLGRPVRATPTPDGKAVLFLRAQARVPQLRLYEFDVATGRTRELLTPEQILKGAEEQLSPEEKARRERMRISVGGITSFELSEDGATLLVTLSGRLYAIDRAKGSVRELQTAPGTLLDPKFAPNGRMIAYVRDHDVYVYNLRTDKERRVTRGGSERLTHGLAEFVAQEEMGRFSGYWWSPDSRFIAYEEADVSGVEVWHVADPARPEQAAHPSYYPRPGKANVKVRLGVVSIRGGTPSSGSNTLLGATAAPAGGPFLTPQTRGLLGDPTRPGGKTVWIDWNTDRYPYLADVQWKKKAPLTVTVQTREQQELVLLQADPASGRTRSLLTEDDPAWVNLHGGMPKWLEDGSGFLWISERGGGPELELRSPEGERVRVLVPKEAGLRYLVDADPKSGRVVYVASADPTQAGLFQVGLQGGKVVALSDDAGWHGASFSKDHSVYTHWDASVGKMPRTLVRRADGSLIGELPGVAEEPPFVPQVELTKVGGEPGFHAALVRPRGFDPGQRYPVIVNVYGGPGGSMVVAMMGAWLRDQWLADQGFIIVAVDGRGTPGRGREWERAIARQFGTVPLDDQVAGLKALGQRFPELDLDRVGIVGWSFGGYMAALAVLKRPDTFKAAVAGAPVVDWFDYDTHYTERYLGLPDQNAEAYKEGSLLTYASDLSRPLLLIHGTGDDNVFFRHTLRLADALFRAGKEFELLPLSGTTHMVPDPVLTERLWSRIARHFQRNLGPARDR